MDREFGILKGEGIRESAKGAMSFERPEALHCSVFHRDIKKHLPAWSQVGCLYLYVAKVTRHRLSREY